MYRNRILLFVLAALLFVACGNKEKITIQGTIENGAGKTIYFEEMSPDSPIFLDSVVLDNHGGFKFSYQMPYKTFVTMHVSPTDYVVLLPEIGETIEVSGDYNLFSHSYQIKAGHDSQLLWQLQDYSNQGAMALHELVEADNANRQKLESGELSEKEFNALHERTDSLYLESFAQQQKYVAHFIEDNLGSLATLIALYKPFNSRPLVDPADSFEFYEGVLQGLEESLPDNPHTIHFKNTVENLRFQYAR